MRDAAGTPRDDPTRTIGITVGALAFVGGAVAALLLPTVLPAWLSSGAGFVVFLTWWYARTALSEPARRAQSGCIRRRERGRARVRPWR